MRINFPQIPTEHSILVSLTISAFITACGPVVQGLNAIPTIQAAGRNAACSNTVNVSALCEQAIPRSPGQIVAPGGRISFITPDDIGKTANMVRALELAGAHASTISAFISAAEERLFKSEPPAGYPNQIVVQGEESHVAKVVNESVKTANNMGQPTVLDYGSGSSNTAQFYKYTHPDEFVVEVEMQPENVVLGSSYGLTPRNESPFVIKAITDAKLLDPGSFDRVLVYNPAPWETEYNTMTAYDLTAPGGEVIVFPDTVVGRDPAKFAQYMKPQLSGAKIEVVRYPASYWESQGLYGPPDDLTTKPTSMFKPPNSDDMIPAVIIKKPK